MNLKTLTTLTTLMATACIASSGGVPPSAEFRGAWAGVNGRHGPGSTGGLLTFSVADDKDLRAISAAGTSITGSVTVPDLRHGTFESRTVTGTITPKGRIRARFKGGHFNGHTDRGAHDAGGFLLVNVGKYQAVSFWYADQEGVKTAE